MAPPKGNKNALKHGLWAHRISSDEKESLTAQDTVDLQGEIAYLRTVISRIAVILESNGLAFGDTRTLTDETIKTFNSLNRALATLLNYVTQFSLLTGELTEFEKQVEDGKFLARTNLGVYDYLNPQKGPARGNP